jgi:cell fate regulator YaaT (PSP1 superfamily)
MSDPAQVPQTTPIEPAEPPAAGRPSGEPENLAGPPPEAKADQPPAETGDRPARPAVRREEGRPRMIVRYGLLSAVGEFTHPANLSFPDGGMLVVQTERGIEIGQHVSLTPPSRSCSVIEREAIRRYVDNSGPEYLVPQNGRVLRVATRQDLAEQDMISANAAEELDYCKKLVRKHGLPMKLIACEHLFGGERIVFYFMAEGRVDFRELVRDLAHEYQTRIEMHQVGARDEARLVADYEICGRECCCKNFLKTLRPVSMKMAKMQKATLDPTKVSGRCGRLRCCLRYEHETYENLNRRLPRTNAWVRTAEGDGKVVDRQVLTQLVTVLLADQRQMTFPAEETQVLADKPPPEAKLPATNGGEPAADPADIEGDARGRRGPARPSVAGDAPRRAPRSFPEEAQAAQKDDEETIEPPQPQDDTAEGHQGGTEEPELAPSEAQTPSAPPAGAGETGRNEPPDPREPRGRRRRRRRRGGNRGGNV